MEVLIYSGGANVGKTGASQRTLDILQENGFTRTDELPFNPNHENFAIFLEKVFDDGTKKRVFINSWSDETRIVRRSYERYASCPPADVIITACREIGAVRELMFELFPFEERASNIWELPLGKVVRGRNRPNALRWHGDSLDDLTKKILSLPNYSLLV